MNYIKHLTAFFNHIAVDDTINTSHISLYITIFQYWNVNRFKNPVNISRNEVMRASKIASYATYHKRMRDLVRLGYLEYSPSYNRYSGTSINVVDLTLGIKAKSVKNELSTNSKNEPVQKLNKSKNELTNELPIYNNKTYINNKDIYREKEEFDFKNTNSNFEQVQDSENESSDPLIGKFPKKEKKSSAKKKERIKSAPESFPTGESKPSLELVKEYFEFQKNSEFEAERFFNYYSSNGWLIGGKTKMEDWKASARNWMLNTNKFAMNTPRNTNTKENDRAQHLQTNNDKDYSEPL